jgi:hypothetical protein
VRRGAWCERGSSSLSHQPLDSLSLPPPPEKTRKQRTYITHICSISAVSHHQSPHLSTSLPKQISSPLYVYNTIHRPTNQNYTLTIDVKRTYAHWKDSNINVKEYSNCSGIFRILDANFFVLQLDLLAKSAIIARI